MVAGAPFPLFLLILSSGEGGDHPAVSGVQGPDRLGRGADEGERRQAGEDRDASASHQNAPALGQWKGPRVIELSRPGPQAGR